MQKEITLATLRPIHAVITQSAFCISLHTSTRALDTISSYMSVTTFIL